MRMSIECGMRIFTLSVRNSRYAYAEGLCEEDRPTYCLVSLERGAAMQKLEAKPNKNV